MISNIDQIKAAANVLEVIQDFLQLKKSGSEYECKCPFHTDKTPSFKVSPAKQIYKCFGCGKSGDAIQFLIEHEKLNYIDAVKYIAKKYNIEVDETSPKSYEKPIPRLEKVSPEVISYFQKRGISNDTLLRFKITEAIEWMPKAKAEVKTICFNYYKDEILTNIKFRAKDKDFKLTKNAELIFYNLDQIKDETDCIITEGEIDCLSLHEAGIYNSVSVPNGAATGHQQLNYLDNCYEYFINKQRVIIATDNDAPGKGLRDELARRIGYEKCFIVEWPNDCKDMNDVLVKHGKHMVHSMIEQAKQWPIEGVLTMDDLFPIVQDYYENGYPKGYETHIPGFNELLHFSGSQFTVVTGSPGSGKSEFIDYITTSLARIHNWKFAICSFENPAAIHTTKIMEKFIGLSFNFRKDPSHRMNRQEFEEAIALTDQYFSFVDISQADVTIAGILDKCRELVRRVGVKGIVIDPWNYIEHKVPAGYTETQYISEALSLIKEFAVQTDTHIFIVAHPRKLMKDQRTGQYPVATMYDISGSAHFFNKADNGLSIHRDFSTGVVDVYVQKVRFSWLGKIGFCSFNFDNMTRKYVAI
jgi:twinkle protein